MEFNLVVAAYIGQIRCSQPVPYSSPCTPFMDKRGSFNYRVLGWSFLHAGDRCKGVQFLYNELIQKGSLSTHSCFCLFFPFPLLVFLATMRQIPVSYDSITTPMTLCLWLQCTLLYEHKLTGEPRDWSETPWSQLYSFCWLLWALNDARVLGVITICSLISWAFPTYVNH